MKKYTITEKEYSEMVEAMNTLKSENQKLRAFIDGMREQLIIGGVSSSSIPEPPKPPLCRVLRTGVGHFCKNCNSTMSKSGFLMLFGKRYCDNKKCPNSKPEKNYY